MRSTGKAEKDVTPHLQFKVALAVPSQLAVTDWVTVLRSARTLLQPLHDFVTQRSRA